jgi:hypothetical protein
MVSAIQIPTKPPCAERRISDGMLTAATPTME